MADEVTAYKAVVAAIQGNIRIQVDGPLIGGIDAAAAAAIDALRALPVADLMETFGMEPTSGFEVSTDSDGDPVIRSLDCPMWKETTHG